MTMSEFVRAWAELVAEGRQRIYPDVRPSERAVNRIDDEKSARRHWKKWRSTMLPMSVNEFKAQYGGAMRAIGEGEEKGKR
jgi:hypothetical protein